MALARYFSKDLLALNQLLKADHTTFEKRLESTLIRINFEENATATIEGKIALELLVRLLARFYPRLSFHSTCMDKKNEMIELSKKINSLITIEETDVFPTLIVNAGKIDLETDNAEIPIMNFGSDNWLALFSCKTPQKFGDSENPIGPSIAACLTASNIFRKVFREELGNFGAMDTTVCLSGYSLREANIENPPLKKIKLEDTVLCGIGAIGNGAAWILGQIPNVSGKLVLVDPEKVELTNLQRYILTDESHWSEEIEKVTMAKTFLKSNNKSLICEDFLGTWEEYASQLKDQIRCIAVGIDNVKGRIQIQSSLPRIIFNAFTENENIGISRHTDFGHQACLACSYLPEEGETRLNYHEEIAENFQIPEHANLIKDYLNTRTPVGKKLDHRPILLEIIRDRYGIDMAKLDLFKSKLVDQLYSELICGGILLQWTELEKEIKQLDAPLAFQSTLAGILLASEIIKYSFDKNIIKSFPQRTDLYPLEPTQKNNPFHRSLPQQSNNRCLCEDGDFLEVYDEYWNNVS